MKKLTYEQFVETLQPYEIEGGFGVTLEKGYKMYYLPNEHPLLNHKFKHKNKRKAYQEYLELVKDKMASGGSIKGDLKALWNKTVEIAKKGYDKTKEVSKKKIHDGKKSIAIDVINETKSKVGKADKFQLTKAKSIISKKFAKGGLIESFVLQHNDLNRKEMMSIGLSKGDLMKMAYGENTRNVDSALPMGLLEELGISNDERYHYVMDYQTNSFGKLTDLFEKIEERNPKVEVWNTDYEKLDVLPILEAAKKYKNKEVFFQYREQSNKMATGGGLEDYKVGDSVIYAKKFTGINNQGKIVGIEGNGQVFTIKNNLGLVEIVPRISIIKKVNIMAKGGGVEKPKRKKFLLYTNPNNTTSRAYIAIGEEVKEVLRDSREYPGSYYILYQATGTNADLQKAKEMFSNYSFDSSIEIMAKGGMTEHGLEIGDEIIEDRAFENDENRIVVFNNKTKEGHLVDLNKGKRYAKGGGVGNYKANISDLVIGNDYAIVDFGMGYWLNDWTYQGERRPNEYVFTSSRQNDSNEQVFTKDELLEYLEDGAIVENENVEDFEEFIETPNSERGEDFDFEDVYFKTEGDYDEEYLEFQDKLKILRKYIDFDNVSGSSNSYETNLNFEKDGVKIANINGEYDSENSKYTCYLTINDNKAIVINFHPYGAMGGFDSDEFEKQVKQAVENKPTTSTYNSNDEILDFEKVKPGMYAFSVDDEPFQVVTKGYGYEYDSKLKKYDSNGIIKDIKDNPSNYGMLDADFDVTPFVVVLLEDDNQKSATIYTYDTDGMVVYEDRLPAPLSFYDDEEEEEEDSIDYEISDSILKDMFPEETKEEAAGFIADDLGLIQANVIFDNDYFEVKGVRKNGDKLEVSQRGEFTKFGGPYSPKMEQPQVLLNGENITKEVEKALADHFGIPNKPLEPNAIMLFRTDIWGYILDKISTSKATQTTAIATPTKIKESGAAGIKIELSNGNITVYHSTSNEVLLSLKDVPEGTWNKLWNFLRNDLV